MSLSCVERAVNTRHCGLSNDDTIRGHLTQQRDLKRSICKMSSGTAFFVLFVVVCLFCLLKMFFEYFIARNDKLFLCVYV